MDSELVLDGTNIAWAWPKTRSLLLQRDHAGAQRLLVATVARSAIRGQHAELTFVFDGPASHPGPRPLPAVRVLHPEPGVSADERILEVVRGSISRGLTVLVVSSDRELRELVQRLGATTAGAREFMGRIDPDWLGPAQPGPPPPEPEKPAPSHRDTEAWLRQFAKRSGRPQKTGDSR